MKISFYNRHSDRSEAKRRNLGSLDYARDDKCNRHCERSEAIQLTMDGLSRRLQFLAMTISMLVFSVPANAMQPCGEKYTLEHNLQKADLVFEGHFLRFDTYKMPAPDAKKSNSNINKPMWYFAGPTFAVDKNWKGTKANEEIKTAFWMPVANSAVEFKKSQNYFRMMEAKKPMPKTSAIVLLQKNGPLKNVYFSGDCETSNFEITPENLKVLQKKFLQGADQ